MLTLARGTPGRGKVGLARLLAIFLMLLVLLALLLVFLGIWWGALLAASLAFLLKGAFRKQGARRDRYLREQFPEALDLLVRGARVGVSLEENLRTVAREMPAPTGPFFAGMVGQLDMGVPFETVLKKVAGQTGLREYRYFVATLSIQRLTGGAYADVLHRLSRMLRDYEEQAKRADVATSEARLSARIVAGLGIVSTISLFFLNRQQFEFLATDPEGQQILLYCLGSVLTGFAVISHLVGRIRE
ncbi:hypothetical protein GCM10007924_18890 [Sneathiella chinensis]|uniref:Type II secretion system protein GspF domain-containing protein n=1 Tax=Sneathiella chinensis TaxID=349750 RepID=A0ABQ5U496_9PROT|nr:hypothetical protein GCM10007924_18890 [Sneathiella chinensis]